MVESFEEIWDTKFSFYKNSSSMKINLYINLVFIYQVIVKLYPKLYVGDMKDRIVEVGKNVDFSCSAKMPKTKLTYYVNGQTYNSKCFNIPFYSYF